MHNLKWIVSVVCTGQLRCVVVELSPIFYIRADGLVAGSADQVGDIVKSWYCCGSAAIVSVEPCFEVMDGYFFFGLAFGTFVGYCCVIVHVYLLCVAVFRFQCFTWNSLFSRFFVAVNDVPAMA